MTNSTLSHDLILEPLDNQRLMNLCGQLDEHLRQIERRLGVEVNNRGNVFCIIGEQQSIDAAQAVLMNLYSETSRLSLTPKIVHEYLQESEVEALVKVKVLINTYHQLFKHHVLRSREEDQIKKVIYKV